MGTKIKKSPDKQNRRTTFLLLDNEKIQQRAFYINMINDVLQKSSSGLTLCAEVNG